MWRLPPTRLQRQVAADSLLTSLMRSGPKCSTSTGGCCSQKLMLPQASACRPTRPPTSRSARQVLIYTRCSPNLHNPEEEQVSDSPKDA